MRTRFALAVLAVVPWLTACPRLDPMWRQPREKAYQAIDENGDIAMKIPPEGTVPFRSVLPAALATGRGPDGKYLPLAPVPFDAKLLAHGRKEFEIHCAACHGVLGDGESQVALNMSLRKPPSLHKYRDQPDGFFFEVISHGFGLMASYASELTPDERWAIVGYVRALQLSQSAGLEDVPEKERQKLGVGR